MNAASDPRAVLDLFEERIEQAAGYTRPSLDRPVLPHDLVEALEVLALAFRKGRLAELWVSLSEEQRVAALFNVGDAEELIVWLAERTPWS